MKFLAAIEKRRSIRDINNTIDIEESELIDIIKHNLKHTPSAYNAQSQKVMVLLGEQHLKFWNLTKEALRKIVPEKNFGSTESKMDNFGAGYGTILFFDDLTITNGLVDKFPTYKQNFLTWAEQQNGMLQANIWSSLASKNIGASLQHYNEIIENQLESAFGVSKNCKLIAQMPFGGILKEPSQKQFQNVESRIIIIK
ncbi:nitroreductase family protein [Mycoplasmatota bacterium WC30]